MGMGHGIKKELVHQENITKVCRLREGLTHMGYLHTTIGWMTLIGTTKYNTCFKKRPSEG